MFNYINSPLGDGQRACYGCQVLSRHPQNGGLLLVAITLLDVSGCIRPHGWPIVALGISPMRQSSATWMVSAYSFMEFRQCILIHVPVGGPESTKFINLIPPTVVAWLLQYSGSRVEHMDGFSSHK